MKVFGAILAAAGVASAQTLAEVIAQNNATLSTLAQLVTSAGLLDALASAQGITILAPTNDAFTEFTTANPNATEDTIRAVLQYHVLNGTVRAADILGAGRPLFPRTLLSNDDFEEVDGAQYVEVQGSGQNVTIFSGLEANASVVTADVNFTGGVIHVIDSVLNIPQNLTETALALGFKSLAGALIRTGLLDDVEDLSNITVFAPTDAAFQNIGSVLSNATNETIAAVLQYHVIQGSVTFSTDLVDGAQIPTLGGGSVTINQEGENFFVNGALIASPNVLVENGVVHGIDQVLNPMNATAAPAANATAGSVQFGGAQAGSEPPLTSGLPTPTTTVAPPAGTSGGAATSGPAQSTGAAAKVGVPLAGAVAGIAAFLL